LVFPTVLAKGRQCVIMANQTKSKIMNKYLMRRPQSPAAPTGKVVSDNSLPTDSPSQKRILSGAVAAAVGLTVDRLMSAKGHASALTREVDERENKTGIDGQKLEASEAQVSSVASSNWKVVQHRRRKASELADTKSMVIWGIPTLPLTAFWKIICKPQGPVLKERVASMELKASKRGGRFLFVTSLTPLVREACLGPLMRVCAEQGWKACKSRPFQLRNKQRRPMKVSDPLQEAVNVNRFAALAPDVEVLSISRAARQGVKRSRSFREFRDLSSLQLGTLNVQGGLHSAQKCAEIETHARIRGLDVLALQETRLKPNGKVPSFNGFSLLHWANADGMGGVGFLVANHIAPLVAELPRSHANQLWIKVRGTGGQQSLCICSAYMPQESANAEFRTEAWDNLLESTVLHQSENEVVIAGDLNAKLGRQFVQAKGVLLNRHDRGKLTGNGKLLVKFLGATSMVSLGPRSRPAGVNQKQKFWYTRLDPKTGTKSQIDHILVSLKQMKRFASQFEVDYTELGTDHHLCLAKVLAPKRPARLPDRVTKRFLVELLAGRSVENSRERKTALKESAKAEYVDELAKAFGEDYSPNFIAADEPNPTKRADAVVADFVKRMETALEASVGSRTVSNKFSRSWFSADVKKAIQERRKAYEAYRNSGLIGDWNHFCSLRKAARTLVRSRQKEEWDKLIHQLEETHKKDARLHWSLIKRITARSRSPKASAIRQADGTLTVTDAERRNAWGEYLGSLGRPTASPLFDVSFEQEIRDKVREFEVLSHIEEHSELVEDFSPEEWNVALASLKNGKAAGLDGIRNEALKYSGDNFRSWGLQLFNWIQRTETIPPTWGKSLVVFIYKDGEVADPSNYRGISLISCLAKLYLNMWTQRLTRHIENRLADEQNAFRRRRSTGDSVYVFHEALLRHKRGLKPAYCCFIDFRKAFDYVWRDGLSYTLWEYGVRGKAWRILRAIFSDVEAAALIDGIPSKFHSLQMGVRQGDPLSPLLFIIFINRLADALNQTGIGLQFGNADKLASLLFADDIVLLAESAEDLQKLIDVVADFCGKWRMHLNVNKTKVMVFNAARGSHGQAQYMWKYAGESLEQVSSYKYLGVWFSENLGWNLHISKLVTKGNKTAAELGRVFAMRKLPIKIKSKVWTTMVRSVLEYCAMVWKTDAKEEKYLESIQHRVLTKILRTNSKANKAAPRFILGLPSLATRRNAMRLLFLAEILTKPATSWVRRIFDLPPVQNQVRGPTRSHWKDSVLTLIESDNNLSEEFRALTEALQEDEVVHELAEVPPGGGKKLRSLTSRWYNTVKKWVMRTEIHMTRGVAPGTLALLARALQDDTPKGLAPMDIVSRGPSMANWVRIRLLSGTSSLNDMMERITSSASAEDRRSAACPLCQTFRETVLHFLLDCSHFGLTALRNSCLSVLRSEAKLEFDALDKLGQCCLILGGVLPNGSLSLAADKACENFVGGSWNIRCKALTELGIASPMTSSFTSTFAQFAPVVRGVEAHGILALPD